MSYRLGVDVGGTFTDLVLVAPDGGWGDPFERDPERVRRDVMEEKITAAYARREYGVAIDERTGAIQSEETARLRARRA